MSLPDPDESSDRFELPTGLSTRRGPEGATPRPFDQEPDPVQRLFPLVWNLVRVVCFAAVLVWMVPRVLTLVGASEAYHWVRAHAWVRWISVPAFFLLFFISALEPLKAGRVGEDDDPAMGPAPEPPAGLDPTLGLPIGDSRRWTLEGWTIEAGTWSSRNHRHFVASAKLPPAAGFAFSARDPGSEPAWLRGLAQGAIRMGVEQVKKEHPELATRVDAMDFLSRDPMPLAGHPLAGGLLLRSNDPARASALFADGDVVREIQSLAGGNARWTLTLLPDGANGGTLLRFEGPGSAESEARDATVQVLLSAILRRLDLPEAAERDVRRSREVA